MPRLTDKNGNTLFQDVLLWSGLSSGYSPTFSLSKSYKNFRYLIFIPSGIDTAIVCPIVDGTICGSGNVYSGSLEGCSVWKHTISSETSIRMNCYVVSSAGNGGLQISKIYGRY